MKRHHLLKHADLCTIRGGKECPCLVESVALGERAEGEDGLPSLRSPAHATALHSLRDEGFTGGFDDARAYRQVLISIARIAHAVAILAKVA